MDYINLIIEYLSNQKDLSSGIYSAVSNILSIKAGIAGFIATQGLIFWRVKKKQDEEEFHLKSIIDLKEKMIDDLKKDIVRKDNRIAELSLESPHTAHRMFNNASIAGDPQKGRQIIQDWYQKERGVLAIMFATMTGLLVKDISDTGNLSNRDSCYAFAGIANILDSSNDSVISVIEELQETCVLPELVDGTVFFFLTQNALVELNPYVETDDARMEVTYILDKAFEFLSEGELTRGLFAAKRAFLVSEINLPLQDPQRIKSHVILGRVLHELQKYGEAEYTLRPVILHILENNDFRIEDRHIVRQFALILSDERKFKESFDLLQLSLASAEKDKGQDVAAHLNDLGIYYADLKKYDEAEVHYRKSLDYSCNDYDRAVTEGNLGYTLYRQNRYLEGRDYLSKARAYLVASGSNAHRLHCISNDLGLCLHALGELQSAREVYEECLNIGERIYPSNFSGMATALQNLSGLLDDLGLPDEAKAAALKADKINATTR